MRHLRFVCVGALLLGLSAGGLSSCGGGSTPQEDFCQSWAAAFCKKLYDCTPVDQRGADFLGGSSEAQCTQGWDAVCIQPQQNGQTFDVNCSGGVHVNTAAKSACMNELSTITCDEFSSPNYMSVCTQVCGGSQSGGTGGSGTGGSGTGGTGTGGSGTGGTGGTGGSGTGGTGGATACGTVEPCGGDLVGTWTLATQCLDPGEEAASVQQNYYCAQATVASSALTVSGSVAFSSSMSYSVTESVAYRLTVNLPLSCTGGEDCLTYGTYLSLLQSPGTTISCSGTTACTCAQTTSSSLSDSGTYVLSGSNATLTSSTTGSPSTNGYCVQGSTIHLIVVDPTMSTGPNHQATIVSDLVGHKQ